MGRPLSGKNQFPFGKNGINISAAKLTDGTELTNLRILKQRSDIMYDLMSADGKTIYTFMSISGFGSDGKKLDSNDTLPVLASKLNPGTFCMSIKNLKLNKVQFVVKLESNKIVNADGNVVYASDFELSDTNPVLPTSITLSQKTATMKVGDTLQLTYTFSPDTTSNKSVTWEAENEDATVVDGLISANVVGSTNIIVRSVANPNISDVCVVTIEAATPPVTP